MDKKELFQIQNILETLLEATDHFAKLVKEKELNQSIFMLSSIVEGCQSTFVSISGIHEELAKQTQQIENHLLLIAREIEQSNFMKISEIIQFSLRPGFSNLLKLFIEHVGDQKENKVISIGVFNSWINPRELLRPGRIKAMNKEAEKQSAKLYYFTSKDIDFENKEIEADTFEDNEWKRVTVPFPDVINNTGAGRHSFEERKLRREVPFTSFYVGNKYSLPRRMLKYRKHTDLLIPFTVCFTKDQINRFMEKNNPVVFKDLSRNRGENIYFVTKRNNRYIITEHNKEKILTEERFNSFVNNVILQEKGSYIIQRFILSRTKKDEPFHIRSQVQKNKKGKWVLSFIYAVRGERKGYISNRALGHKAEDLEMFLKKEFDSNWRKYDNKVRKLSVDVAKYLDQLYGFGLEEMGIDFGIDENGHIWMYEVNNGPATRQFEKERAVHTIGYAKYIAENGIMYTELQSKKAIIKGQFDATNTKLPIETSNQSLRVGMLANQNVNENLTKAFRNATQNIDVQFFHFSPKDIDYDLGLIRAKFYEDGKWIQKITEYPDIIVDQYNMRGHKDAENIYRELESVLFLNTLPTHKLNRLAILNSIKDNNTVSSFKRITRTRDVFKYLEKYNSVILYPNKLTTYKLTYSLKKVDKNKFHLTNHKEIKEFTELTLRHHLNHLLEDEELIVQKDSRLDIGDNKCSSIQVNLVKKNTEWNILNVIGIIQDNYSIINKEVTSVELSEIYSYKNKGIDLDTKIKDVSKKVAKDFEDKITHDLNEIYMELTFDKQLNIEVMDLNPLIKITEEQYSQYAKSTLQHAKAVFEKRKLTL